MAAVEGLFIARHGALVTIDGVRSAITPGMTARQGHPVLESYGHLFAPLEVDFDVEPGPEEVGPEEPVKKPAATGKPQ